MLVNTTLEGVKVARVGMGILMNPMKIVEVVTEKNAENVGAENTFRRRRKESDLMTFGNGWLFGIVCGVLINALLIALVIIVEILIDKIKELIGE